MHNVNRMSVDETMLTGRYNPQYRSRDGTVLPPTMTSRRYRQAAMSVVNMSLATDIDCGLSLPRHHNCYDDDTSPRRRAKRSRRRRRHDNGDDVELMDTLDHPPRRIQYLSRDVTDRQPWPTIDEETSHTRRARLQTDAECSSPQPKWTSSRYLQTQTDRHRRRGVTKSRHHVNTHQRRQSPLDDFTKRTVSSPVCQHSLPHSDVMSVCSCNFLPVKFCSVMFVAS